MIIKDAKYVKDLFDPKIQYISANVDGQVWQIPIDSENRMYEEIQEQVKEGTLTIAAADDINNEVEIK
tara:strand:- start:251 stop:454 length:204 start_codon:yes stop_codon:yes gene_type:complete